MGASSAFFSTPLMQDPEIVKGLQRFILNGYVCDAGGGRAGAAPCCQLIQLCGFAGGEDGNGAVGVVAHGAGDTELRCFLARALPEKDAVYFAAHQQ